MHGVNMRAGRDAIHPCAFQRGSFATASLTSLQLTSCNFDVIPFQAAPRSHALSTILWPASLSRPSYPAMLQLLVQAEELCSCLLQQSFRP